MASFSEQSCYICRNLYSDPVTLPCGDTFCLPCITSMWNKLERKRYLCPICKQQFIKRPELRRNPDLHIYTDVHQQDTVFFCESCLYTSTPAFKSCHTCSTTLCEDHMKLHDSKNKGHYLSQPTKDYKTVKCSSHDKLLEYFCLVEDVCICADCRLKGDHQGHDVLGVNEVAASKKLDLEKIKNNYDEELKIVEQRLENLRTNSKHLQTKTSGIKKRVKDLIQHIMDHLKDLEKSLLSKISEQEEKISHSVTDILKPLETEKEELLDKINQIEELGRSDPLTFLQAFPRICGTKEDNKAREFAKDPKLADLDEGLILFRLQLGLSDIVELGKESLGIPEATDMLLDVSTAGDHIAVSGDSKTASSPGRSNKSSVKALKPQDYQVFSSKGFRSGRHYWEVETSVSGAWMIGVSYHIIDQKGQQSWIGNHSGSWSLGKPESILPQRVSHVCFLQSDPRESPKQAPTRFGIYLDYEAGRLSFYELGDQLKHLHTFSATFTKPLYPVFWMCGSQCVWVRIRS